MLQVERSLAGLLSLEVLSSSLVTGAFSRGGSQGFPEEAYEGGSQNQASLWHCCVTGTCLAQDLYRAATYDRTTVTR